MMLHEATWQVLAVMLGAIGMISAIVSVAKLAIDNEGTSNTYFWANWKKHAAVTFCGLVVFLAGIELFQRAGELARTRVKLEAERGTP